MYCYVKTPELCDSVPRNLYLTAAILIREGFITLEDLYPHVRTMFLSTMLSNVI